MIKMIKNGTKTEMSQNLKMSSKSKSKSKSKPKRLAQITLVLVTKVTDGQGGHYVAVIKGMWRLYWYVAVILVCGGYIGQPYF